MQLSKIRSNSDQWPAGRRRSGHFISGFIFDIKLYLQEGNSKFILQSFNHRFIVNILYTFKTTTTTTKIKGGYKNLKIWNLHYCGTYQLCNDYWAWVMALLPGLHRGNSCHRSTRGSRPRIRSSGSSNPCSRYPGEAGHRGHSSCNTFYLYAGPLHETLHTSAWWDKLSQTKPNMSDGSDPFWSRWFRKS